MAKKIYDIIPPKAAVKTKNVSRRPSRVRVLEDHKEDSRIALKTLRQPSNRAKNVFLRKEILVGGGIIAVLLLIWLVAKLPKAEVQLWPKMGELLLEEKITAEVTAKEADIESGVIPALIIEKEMDGWQEFPSTGTVSNDKKAVGVIKIYNKLESAVAITLVSGTHFLSDSGKSFKITGKVVIPAAKYQKGKLVAGSVDAKVEAAEAGESYNIGPSKFSVPKLSGSVYFYNVYAESNDSMTGGYVGQAKKATNDDIEKAKSALSSRLLSEAELALREGLSSEYVLPENAVLRQVESSNATASPNALVDKFDATAKVKVSALVFKKEDVEKFVKNKFSLQLLKDKKIREETLKTKYAAESVDIKNGKAAIALKSSVLIYQSINGNYLADIFSRKAEENIKEIIELKYGEQISKIEVDFWPFWVRRAPKNREKIDVVIQFE